jgi:hypothetical protein
VTQTETMNAVCQAIAQIQERSGDEIPDLRPDTVVIKGVKGFDSLRGLELSVTMSKFFEIPDDVNICISDDSKRTLTVEEIANKLMRMVQKP